MLNTPKYRIPYLEPTDKAYRIADHSKQMAQQLESLVNDGTLKGAKGDRGLPGVNAVPADQAVAAYITDPATASGKAIDAAVLKASGATAGGFSVKAFGAKGDDTANDSPAIQAALDAAKAAGGGVVYFPPGTYRTPQPMTIWDDTTLVGDGATLKRGYTSGEGRYHFFGTTSEDRPRYGGGASRVRVTGLRFRANIEGGQGRAAFVLHHSEDWIVENCQFIGMHQGGHIFDLMACRRVTIQDCVFSGATAAASRDEAIQVDISANGSGALNQGAWSGLPSRDVTVQRCTFTMLTGYDGKLYAAPTPFGSHAVHDGKWYVGLKFLDNTISSPRPHAVGAPTGVLHFVCADGVTIRGNHFTSNYVEPVRGIGFTKPSVGQPATLDPNQPGVPNVTLTNDMASKNIVIESNTFTYWRSTDSLAGDVIYIDGAYNVQINNNLWRQCSNMYDVRQVVGFTAVGNQFSEPAGTLLDQVVNINAVKRLNVQGTVMDLTGSAVSDAVLISNGSGPGRFNNSLIINGRIRDTGTGVDLGGNTVNA